MSFDIFSDLLSSLSMILAFGEVTVPSRVILTFDSYSFCGVSITYKLRDCLDLFCGDFLLLESQTYFFCYDVGSGFDDSRVSINCGSTFLTDDRDAIKGFETTCYTLGGLTGSASGLLIEGL